MSWDSYIDNLIAHTKDWNGHTHADQACIIGLDGSKWTTDGHPNSLKLVKDEHSKIARSLSSGDFSVFQSSGIYAGGIKYQFLRQEDNVVLGKCKGSGAITLQKSKTAVVIAHTAEGSQQGNVNKAVAIIAEYLESLGM